MWQKRNANHYWTAGSHVEAHVRRRSPDRIIRASQAWGWEIVRNGKLLRHIFAWAARSVRDAQQAGGLTA